MNVTAVMTPRDDLVTATVPGSREDVLKVLQKREFSSVPIVKETDDGEVFRGLVSRERLIEEPNEEQLALLLEEVEPVSPEATLTEVAKHMHNTGARRVPVVDGGLSGIVTITDVVRAIAGNDLDVSAEIGEFATREVHSAYIATPLQAAQRSLAYADEPYGVVLDDEGRMEGIFTEIDIVAVAEVVQGEEDTGDGMAGQDSEWAWEGIKAMGNRVTTTFNVELPDVTVESIMTDDVVTVANTKSVTETAQLLIRHDIQQVPLFTGGELAGIVKDMDLLGALYD